MQALVSIITVNYNQLEVTCDLLESLRKISYPNIEILVVDNASAENPEPIKERYPEIELILSEENLGFAGGNNLALRRAKGDYFLFLNNDTEVEPDFLEPLIACLQSDKKIGMVSPKIRFYDVPDTIQYAGYTPMNSLTVQQHLIGCKEKDEGQFNESRETFSIHGAAMCFPRKVVEEVGLMADIFFLYYEELDWAERVKKAGYKAWYVADSLIFHKESVSTGRESPLRTYYIARNRILFARRNFGGFALLFNMMFVHFVSAPVNLLRHLRQRRFDLAKAYFRALGWNMTHFNNIHHSPKLNDDEYS